VRALPLSVENRSEHESRWSFRGPLAIHAGRARVPDEVYVRCCKKLGRKIPKDELHPGGIVGVAELVDIVDHYRSKWFTGPFGLVLRKARGSGTCRRGCAADYHAFSEGLSTPFLIELCGFPLDSSRRHGRGTGILSSSSALVTALTNDVRVSFPTTFPRAPFMD
jgi:hypothetical protein